MADNHTLVDVPEDGWKAAQSWTMPDFVEPVVCAPRFCSAATNNQGSRITRNIWDPR